MDLKNNFSITRLFYKKEINMSVDKQNFIIKVPSLQDLYDKDFLGFFTSVFSKGINELKQSLPFEIKSSFDFLKIQLFHLSFYKEYIYIAKMIKEALKWFIPTILINVKEQTLKVKTIQNKELELNEDIWEYILYLIKITNGLKTTLPPVFNSPEERKLYEAQLAAQEKIDKIKKKSGNSDDEIIMKMLLNITYAFPSLNFDYLFNQSMAQINWLYNYAAKSINYEINAKLFAAGNMKKGKTPEFFIK